jgi:ketosteroid isomerase-like protein
MLTIEAEHLQLVKNLVTAVATRNREAVEECLTPDVVLNVPGSTLVSGSFKGRDVVMMALGRLAEMGGEHLRIHLHDIIANDQHGVVMYDVKAQRDGRQISYSHLDIYHFRDGKIREIIGCPHDIGAFEKLYG